MNELEDLLAPLRRQLAEVFHEGEGLRLDDIVVEKVINRPYSTVVFLRASTPGGDRRLVLKKTTHHPENLTITKRQNQAVVEYDILAKLYPAFQSVPRCSVPKPVLVMPEHEAYVMEFVEGRLLGDYFGAARYLASIASFDELREYYNLCGVWLKKLHDITGVRRAGRHAFDYILERSEQKLKVIDGTRHPACPRELTDKVRRFLEQQLRSVKEEDILVTGRHGDFGSWNIMAGPGGITVFDFLGYREDLLPVDLLKMLTNFEDEYRYLFYSSNRIRTLKTAFLEGYGELSRISTPVAAICETFHRVCCLSARVTFIPEDMHHKIERLLSFNNHRSWLMNDGKKLLLLGNDLY